MLQDFAAGRLQDPQGPLGFVIWGLCIPPPQVLEQALHFHVQLDESHGGGGGGALRRRLLLQTKIRVVDI